ncbi:MAG: 3-deoxy-D-manno-octulosonic acid transferase [Candidatus Cloacimonadota bacterium]|nr:3-deoxy-D-manno-octulosonic acid transferase [Candidatus Cloacimonadota bacterium]
MLFYIFIVTFISLIFLPYFIFKYVFNKGEWKWRLGFGKFPYPKTNRIWIHASSVGEVNGIETLINEFADSHPEQFIYFSTMTFTGLERAKRIAQNHPQRIFPFLLPLDIPFVIKNVLRNIKPHLLILTETEIWPILIHYTKKSGAKILIINGRMTENSFRNYRKFSFLFEKIISQIDFISVQAKVDKIRYAFFKEKNIAVNGNLKFALKLPQPDTQTIKKRWGISSDFVITFGSSRPGEEEVVMQLHKFLLSHKIEHQIIIAPRHLNRLDEVRKILQNNDVNFADFSTISQDIKNFDILLIDKMGELTSAYSISDIAIIGGSFYDFSGHNPLEAAFFGKPILMGKYHSSCKKSVDLLIENNAIRIVDKDRLGDMVLQLYKNTEMRKRIGKNAKLVMKKNGDSLPNTLNLIEKYISYK